MRTITLDDLITLLQQQHDQIGHGRGRVVLFDKHDEYERDITEFEVTRGDNGMVVVEFER